MALRDPATEQLNEYKKSHKTPEQLTTSSGCPVGSKTIQTVGPRGPVLFQDVNFYDEISHFDRERIPERVVHAKGAGAYGYFEVTHDITKYCKAKMFEKIGKKTPMFARFSTVRGEAGAPDTARDPRGFALKFYTEEGNWDMTGNNTPILFIREPGTFVSFVHSIKRNPKTHLRDPDMFWDFMSLLPETVHHLSFIYTARGIPDGYRHMNGYGSHTFKFVNAKDEGVYVKFHFKTDQGIKNIPQDVADKLAITDSDYAIRDLYNAIEMGNHPSWTFYIQVMTFAEAEKYRFHPYDLTLVWPHKEHPLIPVGRFTLNRNPQNYFAEVEQSAFNPSHLIPGIEPSPDKMLQARLLAYPDTHKHRLGANFIQIPVNCPFNARVHTNTRDGPQTITNNQEGAPNYYPNSFGGAAPKACYIEQKVPLSGDVGRFDITNEDYYIQCGNFYRNVLKENDREEMCALIAEDLSKTQEFIQKRQLEIFTKVDPDYGAKVQKNLDKIKTKNGK